MILAGADNKRIDKRIHKNGIFTASDYCLHNQLKFQWVIIETVKFDYEYTSLNKVIHQTDRK